MKTTWVNSLVFIIICLLFSWQVEAKRKRAMKPKPEGRRFALSVNVSEPILKALSKNESTDSTGLKAPTLYLSRVTPRYTHRLGCKVQMKNRSNSSDLFSDKSKVRFNRFDLTYNFLKPKVVSSKLRFAVGPYANAYVSHDQKIFDSGFDEVIFNTYYWSAALGGNAMLQYQYNERLSLFSEYVLAYQFLSSYKGKKFTAFPDQNYANEKSREHGIQFDYPISIYLTYHF